MTTGRTDLGREVEAALGEVLAHVRGETSLPCRIVDDPAAERIVALPQAHEAQPSEIRRPIRPRCQGGAGLGTGTARPGPGGSSPVDRHRP